MTFNWLVTRQIFKNKFYSVRIIQCYPQCILSVRIGWGYLLHTWKSNHLLVTNKIQTKTEQVASWQVTKLLGDSQIFVWGRAVYIVLLATCGWMQCSDSNLVMTKAYIVINYCCMYHFRISHVLGSCFRDIFYIQLLRRLWSHTGLHGELSTTS